MRSVVIVSTARTPIGAMQSLMPGGNVIARLVKRADINLSGVGNVVLCGRGDVVATGLSEVA
jgi:hypothetical protein